MTKVYSDSGGAGCTECGATPVVYRYQGKIKPNIVIRLCRDHAPEQGSGEWIGPRPPIIPRLGRKASPGG